jgi:hypothetical protein
MSADRKKNHENIDRAANIPRLFRLTATVAQSPIFFSHASAVNSGLFLTR